jgi:uncharacterized delta-60 repeat protein
VKGRTRAVRVLAATAFAVGVAFVAPAGALAAPGDLDPTFSGDGVATTSFGAFTRYTSLNDVAIDAQDRIVAAGRTYRHKSHWDIALVRFLPNGSLDPSFSGDGKVLTSLPYQETANAVAIDAQGRIVVAGQGGGGFFFARFLPNGRPDPSFSGDGRCSIKFGGQASGAAQDVTIDGQGRIVAVGSNFKVARLNPNGTLDKSFGSDGTAQINFGDSALAASMAIDSRGRIVVGGWQSTGAYSFAVARLLANGRTDPTFSGDGRQTTAIKEVAEINSIAIDQHNRVVAAGASEDANTQDFALARYRRDGSLDPTFSQDGKVLTPQPAGLGSANSVAIDPGGRILAAGYGVLKGPGDRTALEMMGYRPSGNPDPAFGDGGQVLTDLGGYDVLHAVALDSKDRIVGGGVVEQGFGVVRYLDGP